MEPDVIDVDLQLLANARQFVVQEDVARGSELVKDGAAFVCGQVQSEAPLPPVRMLHERMDIAPRRQDPGGHQSPHGITALVVLDLDDLSPVVRQ